MLIYRSFGNNGLVRVLSFLKAHDEEYLSGQDLSDVLKISRVAVWKHIRKIRDLGYGIESKQKMGYRLTSNSDALLPWEITANLKTKLLGQKAFYFDVTDSTQNQALKMAGDASTDGAIIIAESQTGGKGRSGRRWVSPKGGIWFSVILHPKFDISITTLFPIASSLALSYAIEKTFNITPELKWPNDVTINGKKVAGILVDASMESNKIENLVLGIGINFEVNVEQIEKTLKETPNFYGVASLHEKNSGKTRPVELVQAFLEEMEIIYEALSMKQTKKIISEWTKRSSTIGRKVELSTNDGNAKGIAIRIEEDGSLCLSEKGRTSKILAGDIIHV